MYGSVPLPVGQSPPSHPHLVPARQGLPWGQWGQGPAPEVTIQPLFPLYGCQSGVGLCCHTKTSFGGVWFLSPCCQPGAGGKSWWCLGAPLSLSLPEGTGMADSLGTGTLLVSNSGDWRSQSEEQHVCLLLGMWAGGCCASGTTGELTEPPECLQLLPGALPRCCCSHWGEASPEGNASRLLACQQVAEVSWGLPKREWEKLRSMG